MADLPSHSSPNDPSRWIVRFAPLAAIGGAVLDLAAGGGRHGRLFLARGHPVTFADKNVSALADLAGEARATVTEIDLEDGRPWPFPAGAFAVIVVSNYLFRPHLDGLVASLAPGGLLLYETFACGNEDFGRPRSPDHLLKPGELLDLARGRLQVVAYEGGVTDGEPAAVKQRLCAVNDLGLSAREDGAPPAHQLNPKP